MRTMADDRSIDSYVVFGELAGTYGLQYNHTDFRDRYPADRYRLDLVLEILKKLKQSGMVVIEFQDDGGGIDPDKIATKAIEKGLMMGVS